MHFTVMVVGDDVDKTLLPFEQFEANGGQPTEFVQNIDITHEFLKIMHEYMPSSNCEESSKNPFQWALDWYDYSVVENESEVDIDGCHKYGYVVVAVDKDSNPIIKKVVQRTNPNGKWDWYQIGGRWCGLLKLKTGKSGKPGVRSWGSDPPKKGYTDSALKCDIDWEFMRQDAAKKAEKTWDEVRKLAPNGWCSFNEMLSRCNGNVDAVRLAYWEQEGVIALKNDEKFMWLDYDDFLVDRTEYAKYQAGLAGLTFAYIDTNGVWHDRDSVVSSTNKKQDNTLKWQRQFHDFIDGLPNDARITIVDCHC